jgi:hypothetical protein
MFLGGSLGRSDMSCEKIPELLLLQDHNGDYEKYEVAVYAAYNETFSSKQFYWGSKIIRHKQHPLIKGMSATFWHIVSTGKGADELPDLRRYERIAWPSYIMDYCLNCCDSLKVWKNKRKGKTRILLWCEEVEYLVILDERSDYCVFWTAYPVNREHTRTKLQREYDEYKKKQQKAKTAP